MSHKKAQKQENGFPEFVPYVPFCGFTSGSLRKR